MYKFNTNHGWTFKRMNPMALALMTLPFLKPQKHMFVFLEAYAHFCLIWALKLLHVFLKWAIVYKSYVLQ